MNINWVATNKIHRDIVAAKTLEEKQAIYREQILAPWKNMMSMMGGSFQTEPNDEFGVARAWCWYLPEDLQELPQEILLVGLQVEHDNTPRDQEQAVDLAVGEQKVRGEVDRARGGRRPPRRRWRSRSCSNSCRKRGRSPKKCPGPVMIGEDMALVMKKVTPRRRAVSPAIIL